MRTPTLQYLYLQKPLLLLLGIVILSVCWIYDGEFYTKGEPREAAVAVSMLNEGNWVLPKVYADEFAYKPPLSHWLIAFFSVPQGEVTPFTSRLPSALAFIVMIASCFIFFGRRMRLQRAFLTCIILITCIELHRAAMTARVDMMLTLFIVLTLIRLFNWEEKKKLCGFPVEVPLLMGIATLVKGSVGIVLPLLVFGIYLLMLKYNLVKILAKFLSIGLASLILPAIWYVLAFVEGGRPFFDLVWAENIGRFLGRSAPEISYNLGHQRPFWYTFITLIIGFIPWTIFLLFSLFGINYTRKNFSFKKGWKSILNMEKVELFSLVAAVVIVIFYCIPISKRSVYLMPAYPFIAVFMARYILYLSEYKSKVTRVFSIFIGFLGILAGFVLISTVITHLLDPEKLFGFIQSKRVLADLNIVWSSFDSPRLLYVILFCILIFALYSLSRHLRGRNNLKILYSTVAVYIAVFFLIDGIFLTSFKNGTSVKSFAEELKTDFKPDGNIYVLNNLLEYANMYGMNFYLGNQFHDFEKDDPESGYLLIGENDFKKFYPGYQAGYSFVLVRETPGKSRDAGQVIQFYEFSKKESLLQAVPEE